MIEANKIKILAVDVDGTIVQKKSKCSKYTVETIKKITNQDVYIVTGRAFQKTLSVAKQLEIPKYSINCNGAAIWEISTRQLIYEKTINPEITDELVNFLRKFKVFSSFYSKNGVEYFVPKTSSLQKIFSIGTKKEIIRLYDELSKKYPEHLTVMLFDRAILTKFRYIEIIPKNVSKGDTLKYLANSQGVSMEEVVAFGDDVNDIKMLEMSGFGVAMGNAKDTVKNVSNYVTLSNKENGVADFINKYIL